MLLCSSVGDKSVEEFATNEAIQCTEIYEFVQQLGNHEYEMPTLQVRQVENQGSASILAVSLNILTRFRYASSLQAIYFSFPCPPGVPV